MLISDKAFAGSDSYATAHIIASAIAQFESDFDLILCGKQAIDGDTAQVPAELAEFLSIPQINYCESVKEVTPTTLRLSCEADYGYEIIEGNLPLLVTVSKGHYYRNFPSIDSILKATKKEISTIDASTLTYDSAIIGLTGSPTKVVRTEVLSLGNNCEKILHSDAKANAIDGFWKHSQEVANNGIN